MNYEFSPEALEVMTDAQRQAILTIGPNWKAQKVRVLRDFECNGSGIHGEGWFLFVDVVSAGKTIYVLGVAPNGDMHS